MIDPSFYILDAQGNTMAIYEHTNNGRTPEFLTERKLSGSSRLDQERMNELMSFRTLNQTVTPSVSFTSTNYGGVKQYELANHLGNVLEVITDGKLPVPVGVIDNQTVEYYPLNVRYTNGFGVQVSGVNKTWSDTNSEFGVRAVFKIDGNKISSALSKVVSVISETFRYNRCRENAHWNSWKKMGVALSRLSIRKASSLYRDVANFCSQRLDAVISAINFSSNFSTYAKPTNSKATQSYLKE